MASEPNERYLAITIKEELYVSGTTRYPPLLSPLLVKRTVLRHAARRHRVHRALHAPRRHPRRAPTTSCTSAPARGSCPTPRHPQACAARPTRRCGTRSSTPTRPSEDIIFRDALNAFCAEHPDKVRLVHCLTRQDVPEGAPPGTRRGRVSADLLRELIPDPTRRADLRLRPGAVVRTIAPPRARRAWSRRRASWRPCRRPSRKSGFRRTGIRRRRTGNQIDD